MRSNVNVRSKSTALAASFRAQATTPSRRLTLLWPSLSPPFWRMNTPDGSPNCWHTGALRPSALRASPANSTFPLTSSLEALSAISSGSMFIAPIMIGISMAEIMGLLQRNRSSFGLTVPVQRTWNWIAGFTPRWNA